GVNVRDKIETLRLEFGDTLLLLGTEQAVQNLRASEDILLLDQPHIPAEDTGRKTPIVLATVIGVVLAASVFNIPIVAASTVGCVVLFLTNCIKPKDGYGAIQWNLLFLIFGTLALG